MNDTIQNLENVNVRIGRNVLTGTPRVSIVIPAYNSAEFIAETLDSVLAQKFREYEIIVVNDGSPDTEKFEREIRTRLEEIIYIKQRNAGAGPARNLAIRHARAELIAFLDADDIWLPEYLAKQYVYLNRNELDMVYCDATLFGDRSAYRRTFMETAPSDGVADFDAILDLRCNVITSGTVARRDQLMEAGLFESERVRAHDFHLWLRMAKLGAKIGYQRNVLLKYRVHPASLSGDAISRLEREISAFQRVARTIDLSKAQQERVAKLITRLEADLAVEQGKTHLLRGEYREAVVAFRVANRYRRSVKLAAVVLAARFAPASLVRYFRKYRFEDLALVRHTF